LPCYIILITLLIYPSIMQPGRDPYALKCTLILTSDIVKGWWTFYKSWPRMPDLVQIQPF